MKTVDYIIRSATTFYSELRSDPNGRFRSWEHCYKCFHDARGNPNPDHDFLSLQLAFYLASWGMYRGSSFLLQKDYRIHIPVIKRILKKENDCLFGIRCVEIRDETIQSLIEDLKKYMEKHYDKVRSSVIEEPVKQGISTTLITKILMGTLGCVPAYDRYFIDGVKTQGITTGNYNIRSLLRLADFYEENEARLEAVRKKMKVYGLPYPQMKLLDMGFWQIGFKNDTKKGLKIAH